MSVHLLRCPNCGAELDVVDGVETIRCKFCGARCHVEGHGTKMHLSLLAQQLVRIEDHASRTAAEIEAMRVQQAHGLASQFQTDEALRRAAAAQEAAAHEAAYAARLQSSTHIALAQAGQQRAAEKDAEYRAVLRLRSRYRWTLAIFYIALLCTPLLALPLLGSSASTAERVAQVIGLAPALLALASPLWITSYYLSRHYGRKFNERAFLYGLPEVRVKSKEQVRRERESKRWEKKWRNSWKTPEGGGCGGCLVLLLVLGVGVALCSDRDSGKANQPKENTAPPENAVSPSNAPTNAAEASDPASNSEDVTPSGNEPKDENSPPANSGSQPSGSNQAPD